MRSLIFLLSATMIIVAIGCSNNENKTDKTDKTVEPDNTNMNKRDAKGDTATSFDQSNEQSDLDLVAKIRKRVVDADDMSVKGQNVKIITKEGKVMLRGPVASSAEKAAIEKIAVDAAGAGNVTNNLEVDED